jgi:hypothetical protein
MANMLTNAGVEPSNQQQNLRRLVALGVVVVAAVCLTACGHLMMMMHGTGAKRPAVEDFGPGPRVSASQTYRAMLIADGPLRTRKLQTVQVVITDRDGHPVDGVTIGIDGGMPEHGHGLPTRPRISKAFGGGTYEIEGLRFNMSGWWELKLSIAGAAGTDVVTFNLGL